MAIEIIGLIHNSRPDSVEIKISTEKRGAPPSYNAYGIIADEKNKGSKDGAG